MAKPLATDINSKSVYLKMINKARGEYNILNNKLDRTLKAKEQCYNYLFARKGIIANKYNIDLDNYKIEFVDKTFNKDLALETKVIKLLRYPKEKDDRNDLIQLAKWCSIIKNEPILIHKILVCRTKLNMNYAEYREYLSKYFMKVHQILLEGDAYKIGKGIGTIYFKTVNLSKNKFHIDFHKTQLAKKKLIEEGKTPYRKEDARYAELMGLEYDGVKYVQEATKNNQFVLELTNSIYFTSKSKFDIKFMDYVNLKYRGLTYNDIIKNYIQKESDVYQLQISIKRKLRILEIMNPGIYNKFIRK